ncbi:copper oxidase [Hyphobacterium sp. HN65]|uniref:Copper oxidase n=1 Tax=Hyphobacterium lacteum TaxID=3116575 RepID=A0ABU7LTU8_9PROT|nr:copper oxidase [Hyphobacterium sp. HN65]MEE2527329.1 copper oxidase [Hyphobacterium sp. HN65]
MSFSRRDALLAGATGLVAVPMLSSAAAAQSRTSSYAHSTSVDHGQSYRPGRPGTDYRPVITPNGATLDYRIVDGVKVFHLIAEEVEHEFAPGLTARTWGYNGRTHGPTIECVEGDRVRIYVTNRLIAPTTVHWHGVILPSGMDGVGGLNQRSIHTGETFVYEWTFRQHGTFMYHSHHDEMTQMAMGLMGMIVVHPRRPRGPLPDRDYAIMLSTWKLEPGARRPDPNEMTDFNVLTMNARCYPGTAPLVAQRGERVRIRFGNLSAMDHHPIHLHGYAFRITETDGGEIPESAQHPDTTVLVPTGATRTVEFIADNPGDWAMHCHMTHHVMNQMGHGFPNMIGVNARNIDRAVGQLLPTYMTMGHDGMGEHGAHIEMGHMDVPDNSIPMVGARGPHDYITMGGMFTVLKVRDRLTGNADPGWYQAPDGTQARQATTAELQRDGIDPSRRN